MSIPIRLFAGRSARWTRPALLAVVTAGCAGDPPISTISSADLAINQAMNAKASEYAPADLQRALDKSARAKQAMGDENYQRAKRLAEEAQVDAQVAEAKAKGEEAKRMAEDAQRTMTSLRRQSQGLGAMEMGAPQGGPGHDKP